MKKIFVIIIIIAITCLSLFGQIISQYIETESGTTPKGIEIWNNTEGTLDFSSNNLVIEKGVNGAAPLADYTLSSGTLATGGVIVIGTTDLQSVTEGNGSTFYEEGFTFNGDDALVVKYGGTTTDVFGNPGSDPGTGWAGNGIQTWDQNIVLKDGITTGDADGWTDPSTRFETMSSTPSTDMSGFGISPMSTTVQFTSSNASVSEGSGTYSLTISITNPDGSYATTAKVALTSGSASDINNYTTQTVTFPAGSSVNQSVTITITDDSVFEDDETLTFSLQDVSGGNSAAAGSPSSFNLTIENNDLPNAWINEIHYDNGVPTTDANEGIEVVIENPGNYTLSIFSITLYNGSDGMSYSTYTLDEFEVGSTEGNYTIYYKMIAGIQNGSPDGIALSYNDNLVQFLSYEGTFTANNGAASGLASTDIGVEETGTTTDSQSLQLIGNGTKYSDFTWSSNITQTWGTQNQGGDQSLPVSLQDFNAVPGNGKVTLTWITESETENLGFNLYRGTALNGQFTIINNQLIPGHGSTSERHEYSYVDRDVVNGITYYYKLEDVDYAGKTKLHDKVVSATPTSKESDANINQFRLYPCYPNPFNPETTLRFELTEAARISVQIYDLLGNRITTLTNAAFQPGEHNLTWNGRDHQNRLVGTGIYFLQISDDRGFSRTEKVISLR